MYCQEYLHEQLCNEIMQSLVALAIDICNVLAMPQVQDGRTTSICNALGML